MRTARGKAITIDYDDLRAKALAVAQSVSDLGKEWDIQAEMAYQLAANPAVILALLDENKALRADAERYRFLRDDKSNSLHLSRNGDHACNYVTAREWIEEYNRDWFADDPPEDVAAMKETDTIWTLQIYPNTPIGFNVWNAATLDAAIDRARGRTT